MEKWKVSSTNGVGKEWERNKKIKQIKIVNCLSEFFRGKSLHIQTQVMSVWKGLFSRFGKDMKNWWGRLYGDQKLLTAREREGREGEWSEEKIKTTYCMRKNLTEVFSRKLTNWTSAES